MWAWATHGLHGEKAAKFCLWIVRKFTFEIFPLIPTYLIGWAWNEWNNLEGPFNLTINNSSNNWAIWTFFFFIDERLISVFMVHRQTSSQAKHLSCLVTKPTKWHVHPVKTQISLVVRPVWSESSLSAWRKLVSLATHWVHSEDSDQTGQMPRLIWVFAGHTVILLVLSWGGSFLIEHCFVIISFMHIPTLKEG